MPARYTATAITLHWLIALLLLGQFAFGLLLADIPRGTPARGIYVNLHKSSGILIGLLILLRVAWRLTHKPPPLPATMPAWQRDAARLSYIVLYLCMVALPLSGYLGANFSRHGIKFFNLVHWQPWGGTTRPGMRCSTRSTTWLRCCWRYSSPCTCSPWPSTC